jgi:hypothetical protein
MKLLLLLMVFTMTIPGFAKIDDWERFNSSLLIEVTRPNGVFTCTGVAISKDVVITAAHCLDGIIKGVRIFTQAKYDPKQTSLPIKDFTIHPNYNPSKSRYRSDLAKIVMKESLPPFINLCPIHEGKTVTGQLYRFGFGGRDKKNVRTVITPTFRKMNLIEEVIELNDEFSKSGDSGGPIFMQNGKDISILAVHSTYSHGPEGNYSLNPLLAAYLPWIYAN